jgi:glycerol-3-phosphate acyltransferase PlsX
VSQYVTLALDAMGGDVGPSVTIPAALQALEKHSELNLRAFGRQEAMRSVLDSIASKYTSAVRERLTLVDAPEVVEMGEAPAHALRTKRHSSMRLAINAVKEGEALGMVSAGNTGALMAISKFVLKTLPGVSRPAIITTIPSAKGHFYMLDLGANVDCDAELLYKFAVMGSAVVGLMEGKAQPRVGLLNIGQEAIKGNDQVKQTDALLSASDRLNYIGYVEGDSIFDGAVDVVVCDGFVGNVALKSIEGVAKLIKGFVADAVGRSWGLRLAALIGLPFSGSLKKRLDPRQYNGAALVGLKGCVVKSHGGTDERGLSRAISVAFDQSRLELPKLIAERMATDDSLELLSS